jgi:prevent-host-death family protein
MPRSLVTSAQHHMDASLAPPFATLCYERYTAAVSRIITQRELRNDSAAVLRAVEHGQTLVISRNGTPVAELRPLGPRQFVPRDRIADAARVAPPIDARRFRADVDAIIDQRVDD